MARVPVAGGNQLSLAPMQERRLAAPDFSAGAREVAAGLSNLGNATMRFAEEKDALQAQLDEAAAKQLDTDYANYEREVLHTGDAAFYKQEGFNASNMLQTVEQQLEAKRQELLARASNPRQRAMAGDALERRFGAARTGISTYANKQLRVEETRQSARRTDAAAEDAVTYFEDPVRFAEEIAVGEAEIRTELAKQGAAPEIITGAVDTFRSGVYRRVADGMIGRLEIDKAIGYVAANRSGMTEADSAALDRALAIPLKERKIDGLADYVLGEGRPPAAAPSGDGGAPAPAGGIQRVDPDNPDGTAPAGDPDQLARGFALPMPVEGRITSGFGKRKAPVAGASTNHEALDIAAPAGTPIRAQAAGRVVSAEDEGRAGLVVRVDYGNGVVASYAHMQGFSVKAGDPVKPGQTLGGVGQTGTATGPHVHYTLRVDGKKADPSKFAGVTGRPAGGPRSPTAQTGVSREEAMRRIADLNLPLEEERALKSEVNARFSEDAAILNDQRDRAREQALEILNRADAAGTPLNRESSIPATIWDALSPSDAMAIRNDIRRNAEGPPRETDMGTFLALSDFYATNPGEFARLNPAEYLGRLSKEDFEQVFGTWRRDALQSGSKGSDKQVTHERIRSIMSPALEAAGLTTTGIPTKDADARKAMNQRIYNAQGAVQREVDSWQRANPGKVMPDDMIRSIVDRQLTPTRRRDDVPEEGTFFGIGSNTPEYVPWFERGSLGTRDVTVQIPRAERDRLFRIGRQTLGRDPTPEEISRAYFKELEQ